MIRNTTVIIGIATVTKGAQGQVLKTWAFDPSQSFICDVQPAVLNDYVYQTWGISDLDSNAKLMFMDTTLSGFWLQAEPVNRVQVVGGATYDILGSNPWFRHKVCLLKPIQGGA